MRKVPRSHDYPLGRFARRRPLKGVDAVAKSFASTKEALEWLVAFNRMTTGRPQIEAPREGEVKALVDMAAGEHDDT